MGTERGLDPGTLARAVRATGPLLLRFLDGFDDENLTEQAPGLPNHAAWTLGHCALTMHRAAERLDGQSLPGDAFDEGADVGSAGRFGTEAVAFGSEPVDDPARYPSLARCREIFESAIERLATAAESADAASLGKRQPWGAGEMAMGDLVLRLAIHNGTHAGQLTDLRRALGLGTVIG